MAAATIVDKMTSLSTHAYWLTRNKILTALHVGSLISWLKISTAANCS